MPQRRNVVTKAAVLLVARRMSDGHGKSLNLGRTPILSYPTASIESQANLSPKWDQRIVMTIAYTAVTVDKVASTD
jgi:hypothetical protein